ncbi:nickel-dependent hydrogenase large subunit [Dissulfurirhabdus thermomarina]|uniref:Nickel-dependent hydrogenase large subunit n=1 Tax=Dissulfurirhabdus thermomarina TaxID=1765737 RepID=A0A6N9TKT8_DISTH|nr:nickel-dependent hydrogenase large subunit [Dissulfurirhabdus thermomarina]NDY41688.1 nickel-dependent hydrogenase large subunit [Dissulfurirhabdus thermomarina]NMX22744.1 nickel-dependent hydrogenase large subunit [Dissulfurirhabdus thermomarina]
MAKRIVVDPVTRIEGHLRIDAEVAGGRVRKAWSSGQMWRGIEVILQGRDPRDAWLFTQRICGVCTTVHAITSVRAVENALGLEVPINAQYIRNLVLALHALHDHIVHFYTLSALDWVDVVAALKADPARTAALAQGLSDWPNNGKSRFKAVKEKVQALVESGQLGPFAHGYWGHPAMTLPPEANLMAVSHYLEALDYQRKATQALGILGGKNPHVQNLAVGGVATAINPDNEATLNMDRLYQVRQLLEEVRAFVHQVYLPDVIAVGALYKDWLAHGAGVMNYLAVPDMPLDTAGTRFDLPGGTLFDGDLSTARAFKGFQDPYFRDNVAESIAHSWYEGDWTRHPFEEETVPHYTDFQDEGKYSWVKAPRFQGRPMQVGPLAQVLVGYALNHEPTRRYVDDALARVGTLAKTRVVPAALHSTPGRHLARAIRTAVISDLAVKHWELLVANIGRGDYAICNPPAFPLGEQRGFGFHEAPRGALSHWIVIRDGQIRNYQCVVPSTWNAGPRDGKGQPGPYEAALVGNPVADPERPLEVLRTIHSFDPCIACAVHMLDPSGRETVRVRVL